MRVMLIGKPSFKIFFRRLFSQKVYINRDARSLPSGYFTNSFDIGSDDGFSKIVPIADFPDHPDGAHKIKKADVEAMKRNFDARKTELLVDYEHNSLFGDTKAAGWSPEVEVRDDGLYMKYPEFTPTADDSIKNKEYRYFSPVYILKAKNTSGEKIGAVIHSVAITNLPYMDNEIDHIRNSETSEDVMKYTAEFKKKYGIDEKATDEEVEKFLDEKLKSDVEGSLSDDSGKSDDSDTGKEGDDLGKDGDDSVTDAIMKRLDKMEKRFESQEKEKSESDIEALVNSAISTFKVEANQKEMLLNSARQDFKGTKKYLDGLKVNSVKPGRLSVSSGDGDDTKINSQQKCADFLRNQMAAA